MARLKIGMLVCTVWLLTQTAWSQMWNGVDTLYGNEWIDYDQDYYKILVGADGVYRLTGNALSTFLPANVTASQLRIYHRGEEVALYTSTDGQLESTDFIEFIGRRNRTEIDQYLFENPDDIFHPDYSFFTDTSAYFLTWTDTPSNERYTIQANDLSNPPAAENWFMHTDHFQFFGGEIKSSVKIGSADVQQSYFGQAEGFCTGFSGNTSRTLTINPGPIDATGPNGSMTVRFAARSGTHHQLVKIDGVTYVEDEFSGFKGRTHTFEVPVSVLSEDMDILFEGIYDTNDRQAVSSISLTYPHAYDLDNVGTFFFQLPASSSARYLEITNFDAGGEAPILFDLNNSWRMETTLEGGVVRILLPPSNVLQELVLVSNEETVVNPPGTAVDFVNYAQQDAEFIILYQDALTESSNNINYVAEYANYRANNPYNAQTTVTVDIQQLYDQFAYGLQRHPISIRNFAFWIRKNWTDPQYVLILGKGREYRQIRTEEDVDAALEKTLFVPTFGVPGADNLLFSTTGDPVPALSVGRVAVTSGDQIRIYLEKVQAFEAAVASASQSIEGREWMKRVMHLGGGGGQTEQANIRAHLEGMEAIIENSIFGGEVTSFYKTSTDPVENSQSAALKGLINDGIAILTFFGHSSPNTFDFNFDSPSSYDNTDRYPLMVSFGCFSGQCHQEPASIGETFVLAEDRGAIAFFASVGYGFISSLDRFGDSFYQRLGNTMYGASIGDIHREVINEMNSSTVIGDPELAQQSTLQGDPSLKLYYFPGPDYVFDERTVQLDPPFLNVQQDSFELSIDIRNIGSHLPDSSFYLEITQELPNGQTVGLIDSLIPAPAFKENQAFRLPILGEQSLGLNRFYLTLDARDDIQEEPSGAEFNNELVSDNGMTGIEVYIVSNDIRPVYPPEFGIVVDPQPELVASTLDAFAPQQRFVFQIDTTEQFNSPQFQEYKLEQGGGVAKWKPSVAWQDDLVYYWRVSPDSTDQLGYRWQQSSFLYEGGGEPGWNQSHFFQMKKDTFQFLQLPDDRELAFIDDVIDIRIRNCIYEFPAKIPRYYVGGISPASYQGGNLTNAVPAGVFIAVLDSLTGDPIKNPGGGMFGDDYGPTNYKGFIFRTETTSDREEIINFLETAVYDQQYVVFFTVQKNIDQDYLPETWGADTLTLSQSLYDLLESYGAAQVRNLENLGSRPYSLFFRKGDPTSVSETIIDPDDLFDQTSIIEGSWFEGTLRSTRIGPAAEWGSMEWNISSYDGTYDSVTVNIIGIRPNGTDTLIHEGLSQYDTTLQHLDATAFPYLQLEYFASDETFFTPPNLEYWRVRYKGLPEAALDASAFFAFQADTLQQGEPLTLDIGISNIGPYDMDSLLVHFRLVDGANEEVLYDQRLNVLPEGDTLIAALRLETREMVGPYSLVIDVNPDEDQPELSHLNNIGLLPFRVEADQKEPLLDVTFDGVRIMNGDLVSAEPDILIALRDENTFLELGDTSLFRMLLAYPDGSLHPIYFNAPEVEFYGANVGNLEAENMASIRFLPRFVQDGDYTLFVEAADATGNPSGDLNYIADDKEFGYDYKISFRVITKSSISNVLNYPNPFSSQTYFVYTMTGSEPPPRFKIQILTVSGRIVRELTQADLGMLKVGTHQTDLPWDGTDQFGDPLANGVYLYRVIAQKANGEDFEQYETNADGFFDKGFGKLVIIR
jgi:hypothetical protein